MADMDWCRQFRSVKRTQTSARVYLIYTRLCTWPIEVFLKDSESDSVGTGYFISKTPIGDVIFVLGGAALGSKIVCRNEVLLLTDHNRTFSVDPNLLERPIPLIHDHEQTGGHPPANTLTAGFDTPSQANVRPTIYFDPDATSPSLLPCLRCNPAGRR